MFLIDFTGCPMNKVLWTYVANHYVLIFPMAVLNSRLTDLDVSE